MKKMFLPLILAAVSQPVLADEGMWTLDNFPTAAVKEKYGVDISDGWLETVKSSVARMDSGCSASFVSASGLVLTNHHCALSCIAQNSSADSDLEADGFLAARPEDEVSCPTDRLSVLVATEEVTAVVNRATAEMADKEAGEMRRRTVKRLVQDCEDASGLKCESVSLYQGGQYWLYKYRRYDDIRLVFSPESDIAAFGGDPDNFNFPRWCLDMSILRVYENDKPAATPNYLRWRTEGLKPGEPMFVAGRPGRTQRLLTVSDLKFLRDTTIPHWLLRNVELRGRYIQYAQTSDEARRTVQASLQGVENGIKVQRKRLDALHNDALFAHKLAEENQLKAVVASNPKLAAGVGSAWDDIERANASYLEFRDDYYFIEVGAAFYGKLFNYARSLIRVVAERDKPNEDRLKPYTEAALPRTKQLTLADRPIYPELETLQLSFSLDKMREFLGPDSNFVREILNTKSPSTLAAELVSGTRLADSEVRAELWNADWATIQASDDPMIRLALALDERARALRRRFEDEVEAPSDRAYEKIANARFAIQGTTAYPDATFTLRISYGAHEGWNEKGTYVRPWTTVSELFPRVTGTDPFRLPASWRDAANSLDGNSKFNFVGTTDIIGGNSGSPAIDRDGKLVGLIFDGNIHAISGSYWFDSALNRTVAVHPEIMIESLREIYGADAVLEEMGIE
ncbi:MAG: S46 family peptidase [Gammaproteobacteria bacterium]|nr:S46 family peptidase [Gammaproteobacteria bacterium]MBT8110319.1 S46 family peptidase [Gammaproteobacteria bacterium]NND47666.1 S46 family peptidase [Woeseiaceae bacterium]NNL45022.1 S46 family peptidase [Woeseiaceae bacterium]